MAPLLHFRREICRSFKHIFPTPAKMTLVHRSQLFGAQSKPTPLLQYPL